MKTILVLAALAAVAVAAPPSYYSDKEVQKNQAQVVKEELSNNDGIHPYHYSYELDDGQFQNQHGDIVRENNRESRSGENESNTVLRVDGSYGWTDPKSGKAYVVTYFADETGFHPSGAHLPVAP